MGVSLWATLNGQPLSSGPIFTATSATVVMTELNQFSRSSVVLPAADARAIAAMQPYTLLEIQQDGVGTIGFGYVLNPKQQVTNNGDGTITLELEPLTVECIWRTTRRGWVAANALSVIAARLGSLVPGWTGVFTGKGTQDITVSASLDSPTVVGGFLQVAKQFGQYARQGVDASGAPARTLEMGQFGASPSVTLVSANGGDPDALAANGTVALVATVDRQPNDVSNLVNVCVPFGGGSGDSLVTLERLWRIINDPSYPNYGKWGAAPGSVFPEYDPNYPISDPTNPPTGATVRDAAGNLIQGAYGTRSATLDGHWDYLVYDAISYFGYTTPAYGHKEGSFVDSSLTYADNSVANQELTARALYLGAIANFARFAHPHHAFSCTAPGMGRPTRAGDLIAVDYQQVAVNDDGAVVAMNVQTDGIAVPHLRVMSVVRAFQGDAVPVDTYTLSNLGRFDEDDASQQAGMAQTLVSFQLRQDTSIAPYPLSVSGNADALHPLTIPVLVPDELFRWHRFRLKIDSLPYTATIATATNPAGTPVISADVELLLNTPNDLSATSKPIGGVPKHTHQIAVVGQGGATAPTGTTHYVSTVASGGQYIPFVNNDAAGGYWKTNPNTIADIVLDPTAHTHPVAAANTTIAHIPAGQRLAALPTHTHPLDQRIPDGQTAPNFTVAINGLNLTSGLALTSGSRNADGTFPGSVEIQDISQLVGRTDFTLTVTPGTSAGNAYGVSRFVVTILGFGEFGGLAASGIISG